MKTIVCILIQLLLLVPLISQINWFPVGAKWSYEYSAYGAYGLNTVEVIPEDTVVGTHTYKKLLSKIISVGQNNLIDTFEEYLYVFEENRVITGFDRYGGLFLYDFNRTTDDTLEYMSFGGWSPSPFVVDSIGTIEINGHSLAFQDIRFPDPFNQGEYSDIRVIEGIGSINSHLFHDRTILQPFDAPFYYFRCYEDNNLGLINLSYNQIDCDSIEGITTSIHESGKDKTSIFPNPATDFITIKTENQFITKIIVIDILGIPRKTMYTISKEVLKVDIHQLESGMYFIFGLDKSGAIRFKEKINKYGS